jgi:uncharacterized protein YdhG (YjbR/CyaY superfamily)
MSILFLKTVSSYAKTRQKMLRKHPDQPPPKTTDEYFAMLSEEAREVLAELAQRIHHMAPQTTEGFNYQMPVVKYRGRDLVYYAAFKNHFSLFVGDGNLLTRLSHLTEDFKNSTKSAIHFTSTKPIPEELLRAILEARMAEVDRKLLKAGNKKS